VRITKRINRHQIYSELTSYAQRNAQRLGLDPARSIAVTGFHQVHRVGRDQRLLIELIAQFVQTDDSREAEFGGLPFRGGTTVVFGADGGVRYVIAKPLPSPGVSPEVQRAGQEREQRFRSFLLQADLADPRMAWGDANYQRQRMRLRAQLRELHGGVL
jgi:hypothetical protein